MVLGEYLLVKIFPAQLQLSGGFCSLILNESSGPGMAQKGQNLRDSHSPRQGVKGHQGGCCR